MFSQKYIHNNMPNFDKIKLILFANNYFSTVKQNSPLIEYKTI